MGSCLVVVLLKMSTQRGPETVSKQRRQGGYTQRRQGGYTQRRPAQRIRNRVESERGSRLSLVGFGRYHGRVEETEDKIRLFCGR